MLKYYVKAGDLAGRLRTDKDGVVSFEYVIVAALVIAAVGTAFATTGNNTIGAALTTGLGYITSAMTAAF